MTLKAVKEDLQSIKKYYDNREEFGLIWPFVFATPVWLKTWWDIFNDGYKPIIRSIYSDDRLIGIAPLMLCDNEDEACLIGSPDVCDYLDFITTGKAEDESLFFQSLIEYLKETGVKRLLLEAQRPDSAIFRGLYSNDQGNYDQNDLIVNFARQDQSYEIELSSDWDSYLAGLKKKQRHEVRRKLRRLENEGGSYSFRVIDQPGEIEEFYPHFIELFKQNPEKAEFFNDQMARFFKSLTSNTAEAGLARFGLLELEGKTIAAILYFDYDDCIYLYNSGYDSDYHNLSAGLLSKVLAIKHSIEQDKKTFDFLKGEEVYKSRLGGRGIPIYKVTIRMN